VRDGVIHPIDQALVDHDQVRISAIGEHGRDG
jgi:hypothetical protein